MKIIFDDNDKKTITEWLNRYKSDKTPDDFLNYLNNEMVLTVDAASIEGEFQYWMEDYSKTKPIQVQFIGIDSWNRPIFRDAKKEKNEFYGSTDLLFDYDNTETDVLSKVTAKDLCYFGDTFGCEPMGTPVEVEIIPNPPKVDKPKREVYRAIVYQRGNDWILGDGEKDVEDPDLQIPYWVEMKTDVKKHLKEALEKKYPGKYRLKIIWV